MRIVHQSLRGFTLFEMLTVMAIVLILASIAFPVLTNVQERARVTQDMSNLRQIGLATQMYLNDNDNVLFPATGIWMTQLYPKYLSALKIFQSPFDKRTASEDSTNAPISYGLNPAVAGITSDKITKPSIFILFAPAQTSATTVAFLGTAGFATLPGVTVLRSATNPGGPATGGTHNQRKRINALFGDLHSENMLWSVFTNPAGSDPSTAQRWSP